MKFTLSNEIHNTIGDDLLQDVFSWGLTEKIWGDLDTLVKNCVFRRIIPMKMNKLCFTIFSKHMNLPIKMVKNEYRLEIVEFG